MQEAWDLYYSVSISTPHSPCPLPLSYIRYSSASVKRSDRPHQYSKRHDDDKAQGQGQWKRMHGYIRRNRFILAYGPVTARKYN